jgi:hypothetical protein
MKTGICGRSSSLHDGQEEDREEGTFPHPLPMTYFVWIGPVFLKLDLAED